MTEDPREALVHAARQSVEMGLNEGTVGNFSLRHGAGMLVTPTGIKPASMTPSQIVEIGLDGTWSGDWRPSSEWAIHSRIYQATAAKAVAHCHPNHCVALSALQQDIPPFHYMVAGFGGDVIPCARYACFGSPALAEAVVAALGQTYTACLLASHGVVTLASDLDGALERVQKLETLARQYLLARQAGQPVLLTPAELAEVHARYATYGQQPGKG